MTTADIRYPGENIIGIRNENLKSGIPVGQGCVGDDFKFVIDMVRSLRATMSRSMLLSDANFSISSLTGSILSV